MGLVGERLVSISRTGGVEAGLSFAPEAEGAGGVLSFGGLGRTGFGLGGPVARRLLLTTFGLVGHSSPRWPWVSSEETYSAILLDLRGATAGF